MADKKVRVQIWTDIYYAKFIGIWRPEEESPPDLNDPRPSQEQNIPYLFVLTTMYKPRDEVIGHSPIAPSQHPMHPSILKKNMRCMAYIFANEYGIFKPPTKAHATVWLAKQTVGYEKVKEYDMIVRPAAGAMTLKDLRDHLNRYDDKWLSEHFAMITAEHPDDSHSRFTTHFDEYAYDPNITEIDTENGAPGGEEILPEEDPILQYLTITKVMPIYNIADPYINKFSVTPDTVDESLPPGTGNAPLSQGETGKSENAIATNDAELALLKKHDEMMEVMEVKRTLTKEEVQAELIKDLRKKAGEPLGV